MMDHTAEAPAAALVKRGEGEARWWLGALAEIKAPAADTGGQFTLIEMTHPPGYEAPLHVHHREDEAFWILEGSATLYVGEQAIPMGAGDYALGVRDVPHRYSVGKDGCRMLYILTPGGLEELVKDMSEPAATRTVPPPAEQPPDLAWVRQVAGKHGCELLV